MKVNLKKIKALYRRYRESNVMWSFGGFIHKIGLGKFDLEMLKRKVQMGDLEALELSAFLNDVKYENLMMLEEILVYQYQHPVVKAIGVKYVNFNSIQYVANNLRKQLDNYDNLSFTKAENKIPVLENKSGVSLLATVVKSN